jgi:Ca-activated chloride channel family protein
MFEFKDPYYLFLLLFIPFLVYYFEKRERKLQPRITFPSGVVFEGIRPTWRSVLSRYWYWTRIILFTLIVLALARPRSGTKKQTIHTEGIDILLVIDISTSMKAKDFRPNRLQAAKKIAIDFVKGRYSDRIGVVSFAGESFTQCPLTIDYDVVTHSLANLRFAAEEWDGTAIGNAIATGVDRLRNSKAKSKVMILLTDGRNNRGEIDPKTAAQLAKTFGIKIYTIGAGTRGKAYYPVQTPFGVRDMLIQVDIDEDLLKEIAKITGGKYFRATDNETLRNIYQTINSLEKTKFEVKEFINYKELFYYYVLAALFLFIVFQLLEWFVVKPLPE